MVARNHPRRLFSQGEEEEEKEGKEEEKEFGRQNLASFSKISKRANGN